MNPDNSSNRHRQDAIGTPQVMKDGAEREGERERERGERDCIRSEMSIKRLESRSGEEEEKRRWSNPFTPRSDKIPKILG